MRGDGGVAGEFFPDKQNIISNDKVYNDLCWAYETKPSKESRYSNIFIYITRVLYFTSWGERVMTKIYFV